MKLLTILFVFSSHAAVFAQGNEIFNAQTQIRPVGTIPQVQPLPNFNPPPAPNPASPNDYKKLITPQSWGY